MKAPTGTGTRARTTSQQHKRHRSPASLSCGRCSCRRDGVGVSAGVDVGDDVGSGVGSGVGGFVGTGEGRGRRSTSVAELSNVLYEVVKLKLLKLVIQKLVV